MTDPASPTTTPRPGLPEAPDAPATAPPPAAAQAPTAAPTGRRPFAAAWRALVALAALTGVALDTIESDDLGRLFGYFTVQSNLLLAIACAWSAHRAWTGRPALSPRITGGALLYISITGLVFHFVLSNDSSGFAMTSERTPLESVANHLLHTVTPLAAALDWLVLTAPGGFLLRHAGQWLAYPFLYLPFALIRGALLDPGTEGRYPYPFLDVDLHGYAGILGNAVVFGLAFYTLALVLVLLDRVRPHPHRSRNRISPPGSGPLK
ncbi:Pr6Pr family membrane protein [Streptomyces sp. C36]|uniref:Pr6Pr family membrane protein n=1 Tax=Streptomyces sp. C36 TaxID=3237122 RepID=UPI0034C64632